MDNLPDLGISPTPEMNKITINTEGAQNLNFFTEHGVNVVVICLSAFALDILF
jgi:hypothetical protein